MAELVQKTYANSLFEVALENNALNTVYDELTKLHDIFKENPDYIKIYSAPVVGKDVKHKLLEETFLNKVSTYTLNFLKLLVDNERFSVFVAICDEFKHLYDEHNGVLEVTATTATELSDSMKQKLILKLQNVTKKEIRLKTNIDSSILGGIKLKINNTEIDACVKSRLEELKQSIKQTTL